MGHETLSQRKVAGDSRLGRPNPYFSLGGILGFCCLIVGIHYCPSAATARHMALDSGDALKLHLAHLLTAISHTLLWGGLGLMLLSIVGYLLYRKSMKAKPEKH